MIRSNNLSVAMLLNLYFIEINVVPLLYIEVKYLGDRNFWLA